MDKYEKRTKAPSLTNKYFIHYSKGGYNTCIMINNTTGYVIPNCVGYAHGRLLEILGSKKVNWKLPACNAEDWYNKAKANGLSVGSTPKLGSVIVWSKGKLKNGADGAGHVAVVEAINPDGSILISESGYKTYNFKTETIKAPYALNGYKLEGFVYCGLEFETEVKPVVNNSITYTVKKGDNLTKIAKNYGTTVNRIAKDNNIANPNLIRIGQVLVINK